MEVIDAQIHVWKSVKPGYNDEFPAGSKARADMHKNGGPYLAEDLLPEMDAAGVDRALVAAPVWAAEYEDKNSITKGMAATYPDRFGAIGFFLFDAPDAEQAFVNYKRDGLLGWQLLFMKNHYLDRLLDGRADWVWGTAEAAGIPINATALPLERAAAIAAAHPNLRLEIRATDIKKVLELAPYPNVSLKVGDLSHMYDEPYPFPSTHEAFCALVNAFGVRRLHWASDLTHGLNCTYGQLVTLFTEEMKCLSDSDLEWFMGGAVKQWLDWHPPARTTQVRQHVPS